MDEIWEDEVPDVKSSAVLDGVTAAEMKRVHVGGVDEELEGKNSFDADVAFYQCLEVCCSTGEVTTRPPDKNAFLSKATIRVTY